MIRISSGMIRISGQFSGNPGRLRKRYRQFRLAQRRQEVRRLTSRKMTRSAASITVQDTPSITQAAGSVRADSAAARSSGFVFNHPGRQTTSSRPRTGRSRAVPIRRARVDFPLPAFPVMKILVMA
jgi:hypothetical protein